MDAQAGHAFYHLSDAFAADHGCHEHNAELQRGQENFEFKTRRYSYTGAFSNILSASDHFRGNSWAGISMLRNRMFCEVVRLLMMAIRWIGLAAN